MKAVERLGAEAYGASGCGAALCGGQRPSRARW